MGKRKRKFRKRRRKMYRHTHCSTHTHTHCTHTPSGFFQLSGFSEKLEKRTLTKREKMRENQDENAPKRKIQQRRGALAHFMQPSLSLGSFSSPPDLLPLGSRTIPPMASPADIAKKKIFLSLLFLFPSSVIFILHFHEKCHFHSHFRQISSDEASHKPIVRPSLHHGKP